MTQYLDLENKLSHVMQRHGLRLLTEIEFLPIKRNFFERIFNFPILKRVVLKVFLGFVKDSDDEIKSKGYCYVCIGSSNDRVFSRYEDIDKFFSNYLKEANNA